MIALLEPHAATGDRRTIAQQARRAKIEQMTRILADAGRLDQALALLCDWTSANAADRATAERAAYLSAELLAGCGRVPEALAAIRPFESRGDQRDVERLVTDLLVHQGEMVELRARADAGNSYAASRLADLLLEQHRTDELRARADAGDLIALHRLVDLLVGIDRPSS